MRSHGLTKISEKHGLNPSINVCFFCGEDKELVLFGKLKGDAKAPTRVMANYEPCDKCKEKMRRGVTVIEVTKKPSDALPITQGHWPTGRWCVVQPFAAKALFNYNSTTKPLLLEDSVFELLIQKCKELK